jgi:hypothetical protein
MEPLATWEMILIGALVAFVLFWLRRGIKETWQRSREAEHKDWKAVLIPIGAVVLFVILLIAMV